MDLTDEQWAAIEHFFPARFRRIVTRWEVSADNFLAFVQLGCLSILLRRT